MRRAVLMPHLESVLDISIVVLATLCLRLPGESATENQDAGFQQQSFAAVCHRHDLLGIFF